MERGKLYLSDSATQICLVLLYEKIAQVVHVIEPSSALMASVLCFDRQFVVFLDFPDRLFVVYDDVIDETSHDWLFLYLLAQNTAWDVA